MTTEPQILYAPLITANGEEIEVGKTYLVLPQYADPKTAEQVRCVKVDLRLRSWVGQSTNGSESNFKVSHLLGSRSHPIIVRTQRQLDQLARNRKLESVKKAAAAVLYKREELKKAINLHKKLRMELKTSK